MALHLTHWVFKNLLWVGAGTEMRTQYLPVVKLDTAPSGCVGVEWNICSETYLKQVQVLSITNNPFEYLKHFKSISFLLFFFPQVNFDDFVEVLGRFGLKLEKNLLGAFLSRCSIRAMGKGVPYREFLHRFQDRSESGMVHQILTDPRHR